MNDREYSQTWEFLRKLSDWLQSYKTFLVPCRWIAKLCTIAKCTLKHTKLTEAMIEGHRERASKCVSDSSAVYKASPTSGELGEQRERKRDAMHVAERRLESSLDYFCWKRNEKKLF